MLTNAAPADEIAEIRGQIQMLRDREAELRQGFLTGAHRRHGRSYQVMVKQARRRTLVTKNLPSEIMNDPAYWTEKITQTVVVQARTAPTNDDDFDVFEPFD